MKNLITFLLLVFAHCLAIGQCSSVSVQISSSDTSYIQLYHAGFFNIPSGFANECEWTITDFSGDIIHEATTSGSSDEQSTTLFEHNIPISDSIKATIVITNEMEGIICTMSDTLYWKETEVIPGSFIGNWDVLSSNGGVEEDIISSTDIVLNTNIEIIPSLVIDHINIKGLLREFSLVIINANGQFISSFNHLKEQALIDLSQYRGGIYFIQILDNNNKHIVTKRIVKL